MPKDTWPLGKIVGVYPGADQLVRTVDARARNSVYRRPVTKICLLEAAEDGSV